MNELIPEYNSTGLLGGISLFIYEKKIIYLSLFQDGVKRKSAGFVKLLRQKDAFVLDIHIKSPDEFWDGKHTLFLSARSREIEWGNVNGQNGRADARRYIVVKEGFARFGEEEFRESDLCGVVMHLDEHRWIAGYWQETDRSHGYAGEKELSAAGEAGEQVCFTEEAESNGKEEVSIGDGKTRDDEENAGDVREKAYIADEKETYISKKGSENAFGDIGHRKNRNSEEMVSGSSRILPEPASGDKWEQLQRCYKKVHPFGDERVFISVEPKDFIILQAPYQKLVNNSFLLHGFYNYKHMILGPDKEIGNGDESCFYLGVPGTYFEREKMVAIMFGFQGFECDGAVEIGKFGYYMRKVEL